MLKYIKNHLVTIEDIEIFPVISLTIFTLFFLLVVWRVVKTNQSKINELKNMPLLDE